MDVIAPLVFAVLLFLGYIVYAVIVPIIHYRLGDGGIWVFYSALLVIIGISGLIQSVRMAFWPRNPSESPYISFLQLSVLYLFVSGSFRRLRDRGCRPDITSAFMIAGYTLAGICFLGQLPWLVSSFI